MAGVDLSARFDFATAIDEAESAALNAMYSRTRATALNP